MKTKPSICRSCGAKLNAANIAVGHRKTKPKAGDVSICLYCGHVMVFDKHLMLREPNKHEMYLIAGDPYILAVQRARKLTGKKPH